MKGSPKHSTVWYIRLLPVLWAATFVPSAAQGQGNLTAEENVLRRATAHGASIQRLEQETRRAVAAFESLKNTEGAELFASIERHGDLSLLRAELEREFGMEMGQHVALAATSSAAQVLTVKVLFAAITGYSIIHWAQVDAVLITRNLRSNWTTITRLRPAARQYERTRSALVESERALARTQRAGNVSVQRVAGGRMAGTCQPTWSGPAVVAVRFSTIQGTQEARAECRNGSWEAFTRTSQPVLAAYARLGTGRDWPSVSGVMVTTR